MNDNLGTGVFGYFENVTYWSCWTRFSTSIQKPLHA